MTCSFLHIFKFSLEHAPTIPTPLPRPAVSINQQLMQVDLAGASLSVMGSLQDELFNLTVYKISLKDVFTDTEVKASFNSASSSATRLCQ